MNASRIRSWTALCVSFMALLSLASILRPDAVSAGKPGRVVRERCVIEVPAQTYDETREWVKRIEETGTIVTVVGSPRMMLCRATAAQMDAALVAGASVYGGPGFSLSAASGWGSTPGERALFAVAAETHWPAPAPDKMEYLEEFVGPAPPFPVNEGLDEIMPDGAVFNKPVLSTEAMSYDGYTDFMRDEIALALFLFESDGTIDSNYWDWTEYDVDSVVYNATVVLDTLVVFSADKYASTLTWYLLVFEPTDDRMQIPWQAQYHEGFGFSQDTLAAEIYDNLGLAGTGGFAGYENTRPRACNMYLADSVGVAQGLHHFVRYLPDTCDHPKPFQWEYNTAAFGLAFWGTFFKYQFPQVGDCGPMAAEYFRVMLCHEMIHAFGGLDGSYHWIMANGDYHHIYTGEVKCRMCYNHAADTVMPWHYFENFDFDTCVMGSGREYAQLCLSTARMCGVWGNDFGDAPDPYPTLEADDGAVHLIGGFEWLGVATDPDGYGDVTFENDADSTSSDFLDQDPRSNLDLINADCHDDGVHFTGHLNPGSLDTLEVTIGNHGTASYRYFDADTGKIYLNAWFDWNGDGDWDDAGEQVIDSYSWIPDDDDDLFETFEFTMTPPSDYADTLWARFRLDYGEDCGAYERIYSDANLDGPVGPAVYGEVEDYYFTDGYPWIRGDINRDGAVNSVDVAWLVSYVYQSGNPPDPMELGDVNCDSSVNPLDVVWLYNYVYGSWPEPCCSF